MFDYYQLLNINSNATNDEIKQAYRKAALRYHPDRNSDQEKSTIEFIIIKNAYDILINNHTKNIYDSYQAIHNTKTNKTKTGEVSFLVQKRDANSIFNNQLNSIFWDIEDLLHKSIKNKNRLYTKQQFETDLLHLLFFIEKWVLIPVGLKDYFMEARQLKEIGLNEYINNIILHKISFNHFPYTTIENYFFNIRVRLNTFLKNYDKYDLFKYIPNTNIRLIDSLLNTQNFSIYYINAITNALKDDKTFVCSFEHSNQYFNI